MPNWFQNKYPEESKAVRYRAVVPLDIWVDNVEDPQEEKMSAYTSIEQILDIGSKNVPNQGFNSFLQESDVEKYSDTIPF